MDGETKTGGPIITAIIIINNGPFYRSSSTVSRLQHPYVGTVYFLIPNP